MPLAQLASGTLFARDFRILRQLGEGGMGAVYVVEQISTGRERALKVLLPQFVTDPKSRERFEQEAKVGARIRSEHVVEVVSAGYDEPTGLPWLAMELLEGEELSRYVERRVRLAPDEVLRIFRQLCHALGHAHRAGLVHRDLKPENIYMALPRREDAPPTAKILDFGVAKLVQESQNPEDSKTRAIGSPRWMAPEQADDDSTVSPATDVWALGLIAFFMLTGKSYWKSVTLSNAGVTALLRELVLSPLDPPSMRAHDFGLTGLIPSGFDDWFASCVVREMPRRFADADAALRALIPVLDADGVTAPVSEDTLRAATSGPTAPAARGEDVDTGATVYPAQITGPNGIRATLSGPVLTPMPPPVASATQEPTEPTTIAGPGTAAPLVKRKPPLALLAGGALLIGAAGFAFLPRGQEVTSRAAAAGLPLTFALTINSTPPGAQVLEGGSVLGTTPIELTLTNDAVLAVPRKFTVQRDGYQPFVLLQGPSEKAVKANAQLTPVPVVAAPPPPPPVVAVAPEPPPSQEVAPVPEKVPAKAPAKHEPVRPVRETAPAAPVIRLER